MSRCEFSASAEADLEEIADYIAADNPQRALSFVRELRERCALIADHPAAFRRREELGSGIRVALHREYLILFSVRSDAVLIERIVHGRRNLRRIRRHTPQQ